MHIITCITFSLLNWPLFNRVQPVRYFSTVLMTNLTLPSDLCGYVPRHTVAEWFQMEEVCGKNSITIRGSLHFMFHPTYANFRQTRYWLFPFCDVLQQILKSVSVSVRIKPIIHAPSKEYYRAIFTFCSQKDFLPLEKPFQSTFSACVFREAQRVHAIIDFSTRIASPASMTLSVNFPNGINMYIKKKHRCFSHVLHSYVKIHFSFPNYLQFWERRASNSFDLRKQGYISKIEFNHHKNVIRSRHSVTSLSYSGFISNLSWRNHWEKGYCSWTESQVVSASARRHMLNKLYNITIFKKIYYKTYWENIIFLFKYLFTMPHMTYRRLSG